MNIDGLRSRLSLFAVQFRGGTRILRVVPRPVWPCHFATRTRAQILAFAPTEDTSICPEIHCETYWLDQVFVSRQGIPRPADKRAETVVRSHATGREGNMNLRGPGPRRSVRESRYPPDSCQRRWRPACNR